jgi:adenylosuccinate synthase
MTNVIMVAGLGFGDEGKGTVVEALVDRWKAPLVVRFNGGAQCAHNVVDIDGRHHTFAQFGCGTLLGARTFLSHKVLVDPLALVNEATHLHEIGVRDPMSMLTIDRDAPVITPYHKLANRKREQARGGLIHGSCGMGIGETRVDATENPAEYLRVGDLFDRDRLQRGLARARDRVCAEFGPDESFDCAMEFGEVMWRIWALANRLRGQVVDRTWLEGELERNDTTVFEGAQGVLLDQSWGFQPHTTWSDTTFRWADELIAGTDVEVERIGVTRAYLTRHGAGPMPTERDMDLAEPHNDGGFAGHFRTGILDLNLLDYAVKVCDGIDALAVTHLDRRPAWDVCTSWGALADAVFGRHEIGIAASEADLYASQTNLTWLLNKLDSRLFEMATFSPHDLCMHLAQVVKASVYIRSFGPTRTNKVWG